MNQQHVINSYLTEAPASIRHCPPNLLNNVEWLSAEVMIFCVKSQQSILFSLLKIWPGPKRILWQKLAVPYLLNPRLYGLILMGMFSTSDCINLHVPTSPQQVTMDHQSGFHAGVFEYMATHSRYRNFVSNQQEI